MAEGLSGRAGVADEAKHGGAADRSPSVPSHAASGTGPATRVRLLPKAVAEQIAAGEVVERPASVVKELLENSIDAGARQVIVELTDGGVRAIVVVDDGEGMVAEDAVLAFRRHATSKIASAEDLLRIHTLGFRGEALAAIGAVADVELVTRARPLESATAVRVQGGEVVDVREVGAPVGTRLEVRDLFYNTPARRSFLKAPGTEVGQVSELVVRLALSYPSIGFTLRHGGRALVDHAAVSLPEERLAQVFGRERAAAMQAFSGRTVAGAVHGWIGDPHLNFPTARNVYTYVNGRFVKDKLVTHALMAGYSTLLMQGRYPGAVIFLQVPPEEVDVNVHPAKAEVRFRRGGLVHELITRNVAESLRARGAAPDVRPPSAEAPEGFVVPLPLPPTSSAPLRLVPMTSGRPPSAGAAPEAPAAGFAEHLDEPRPPAAGFFASLRVLGQLFDGYLVCQSGDSMVLIDQHAAHERVTFEHLRAAWSAGSVARQSLLVPEIVELRPREAGLLGDTHRELERIGFEIEPFGKDSFAVRAVPALLADDDPASLVRDLAEELAEIGSSRKLVDAAEHVLATLACHSAVRVGQKLGAAEIQALLAAMDGIDFAGNCPHGRPAYIVVSRGEIERRFRRS
jgi:DNA mismatch repair protein MutL